MINTSSTHPIFSIQFVLRCIAKITVIPWVTVFCATQQILNHHSTCKKKTHAALLSYIPMIHPKLTRLHKSRNSRSELEFDLSNFV